MMQIALASGVVFQCNGKETVCLRIHLKSSDVTQYRSGLTGSLLYSCLLVTHKFTMFLIKKTKTKKSLYYKKQSKFVFYDARFLGNSVSIIFTNHCVFPNITCRSKPLRIVYSILIKGWGQAWCCGYDQFNIVKDITICQAIHKIHKISMSSQIALKITKL